MTNYLLGDCIDEFAKVEPNENSYGPSFQHLFEEEVKTRFLKIHLLENNTRITRFLNLETRCYVSISEIPDRSEILDLEDMLTKSNWKRR